MLERLQSNAIAGTSPACGQARWSVHWRPHRTPRRCRHVTVAAKKGRRGGGGGSTSSSGLGLLQIEEDGSDVWRLSAAVDSIQSGGVSTA